MMLIIKNVFNIQSDSHQSSNHILSLQTVFWDTSLLYSQSKGSFACVLTSKGMRHKTYKAVPLGWQLLVHFKVAQFIIYFLTVASIGSCPFRCPVDWPDGQNFQVPSHTAWYVSGVRGRKAWAWLSSTNRASAMTPMLKPSRTNWDFTSLNVLVISRESCRSSDCNSDCDSHYQDFPPTNYCPLSSPGYV